MMSANTKILEFSAQAEVLYEEFQDKFNKIAANTQEKMVWQKKRNEVAAAYGQITGRMSK